MLRATHKRMTNYTAILEIDKSRFIENIMNILKKTDDINDVKLLQVEGVIDDDEYYIKIGFTSSLNRIRATEKLIMSVKCFVDKLYNVRDEVEYEWE
jgi:hypothetical protein